MESIRNSAGSSASPSDLTVAGITRPKLPADLTVAGTPAFYSPTSPRVFRGRHRPPSAMGDTDANA